MHALITGTPLCPLLLWPALATACIETMLFWLMGYRSFRQCLYFACVNVVSNLLLNEFLLTQTTHARYDELVEVCEVVVVLLEYAICRTLMPEASTRHLAVTLLLTNAASYALGQFFNAYLF